MILCSCNALTVEEVTTAARNGRPTACPVEAYGRLQKAPKCGGCLCRARKLLHRETGLIATPEAVS